ncbi:MAG: enoyl-CoA hydratase/isomerase family protein [Lachnospiraceae bacterium]|nr:enoyl-CoA hydratase/isomerase family protein [Lachnospiraceae bacterium]
MSNVLTELKGNVAVLTINKPQTLNALSDEVLNDLEAAFDAAAADENVYVIVITGAGKAFVAGADIAYMSEFNSEQGKAYGIHGNAVFHKIEDCEKPVIAAINGFALGGGNELAMSTDIRIASTKAIFGQPEVGLGITPGFGGTQRLSRIVGSSKAKEIIFTGRNVKADEALAIGLVSKVVEPEALIDEAVALGTKIARNAQLAVRACKKAINYGLNHDIYEGTDYEAEILGSTFGTADQRGAMKAFVNKEKWQMVNK